MEGINSPITSDNIELIIKANYIFNNLTLASKPRIIKASPKSDITVIWIDVWDTQSSKNGKMLINRCFNVRKHIATIHGANMNLDVPQCKNCWKWGHSTFVCRIQKLKYVKCNELHKSEHHCHFAWYSKANFKINSLILETKQEELCLYSFKCSNCRSDHQMNSNLCPFWKNQFNRESSGVVHTGVEVCRIDSEMSGLVKQPWLQLMCCAICLLYGHNFRCWEEV